MSNGKFAKRKGIATKTMFMILAVVLIVGISVGGTLAWLTDTTESVTNTFTVGDINITLDETKTDFKMVPGNTIEKDPKVTVEGGSEDCWLFVKVEKSNNLDTYITYTVDSDWTRLTTDKDGNSISDLIYYRSVTASDGDQVFSVLTGDQVTVKDSVTKDLMEQAKDSPPTLTFTAYAVQKDNIDTAAAAWAEVNP